ncbi:MAG: hypothetical protein H6625_04610 [Bdellovibrionaceae bacterium]|nr:hypothetical protein [Pseudobdellovibrionaceae bacterium]
MSFLIRYLLLTSILVFTSTHLVWASCNHELETERASENVKAWPPNAPLVEVLEEELKKNCDNESCDQEAITKSIFSVLKNDNVKAYAAITSVMVGSSSLVAFLSTLVSKDHPALAYFMATFLSQITSLGVFVVGAPIWEPLQSKIRAYAYRMTGNHQKNVQTHNFLEKQYFTTNVALSLNEQMSRNVIKDYIKTLTQTLYFAKRASHEGDNDYITSQIAELAVRLHFLYPDVNPTSKIVVNAVHAGFTDFIQDPESYIDFVLIKIRDLDPINDYTETIHTWLVSN